VLIGLVRSSGFHITVIADPDIIANHGLYRGDNAALAVALIDRLLPQGGRIVVDETLHGYVLHHSIWRLLLTPPYLAASLLALLAVAFLVWRATQRFGAPLPPQRAIASGKDTLIDNASRLLVSGGHADHLVGRYGLAMLSDVAERLHLPPSRDMETLRRQLTPLAERRGVTTRLPLQASGAWTPTILARRFHDWKREMLGES